MQLTTKDDPYPPCCKSYRFLRLSKHHQSKHQNPPYQYSKSSASHRHLRRRRPPEPHQRLWRELARSFNLHKAMLEKNQMYWYRFFFLVAMASHTPRLFIGTSFSMPSRAEQTRPRANMNPSYTMDSCMYCR